MKKQDMASMRGVFFVKGTDVPDFATIESAAPVMREDMVWIRVDGQAQYMF